MTELFERIILCLEQRKIFIISMMDITMELAAKSKNEEVDFQKLLQKRGEFMTRIDKCDALVNSTLKELPEAERGNVKVAISVKDVNPLAVGEHYQKMRDLSVDYHTTLARLIKEDKLITDTLKVRHSELREKVNETRTNTQTLYRI